MAGRFWVGYANGRLHPNFPKSGGSEVCMEAQLLEADRYNDDIWMDLPSSKACTYKG